jgi:hypothetical protein
MYWRYRRLRPYPPSNFGTVGGDIMQRIISFAALVCVVWAGSAFGQVNSSVGGIVQDPSKALIPGVTITATNTQTGVVSTTLSNESGAYNFPAILPGIYKLTASLTGFKTTAYDDVNVSPANPVRLNFKLEVGNSSTLVDVTGTRSFQGQLRLTF